MEAAASPAVLGDPAASSRCEPRRPHSPSTPQTPVTKPARYNPRSESPSELSAASPVLYPIMSFVGSIGFASRKGSFGTKIGTIPAIFRVSKAVAAIRANFEDEATYEPPSRPAARSPASPIGAKRGPLSGSSLGGSCNPCPVLGKAAPDRRALTKTNHRNPWMAGTSPVTTVGEKAAMGRSQRPLV